MATAKYTLTDAEAATLGARTRGSRVLAEVPLNSSAREPVINWSLVRDAAVMLDSTSGLLARLLLAAQRARCP